MSNPSPSSSSNDSIESILDDSYTSVTPTVVATQLALMVALGAAGFVGYTFLFWLAFLQSGYRSKVKRRVSKFASLLGYALASRVSCEQQVDYSSAGNDALLDR
jgi:hypothetical protein